jgi:hypothetical protein
MQHAMFQLLQEALSDKELLQRRMDGLIAQQKSLKVHLIEVKQIVQVQQKMPSQMMLRHPVVLIDAFEGNRLPFHLEFIPSFEALFAVLMVIFKDRGPQAVTRVLRQLFDMHEISRQIRIDFGGSWTKAIMVYIPGDAASHC